MLLARRLRMLITAFMAVAVTCSTHAQGSIERVRGFTRATWSTRDGVPSYIFSMAQTPDGWLWLASKSHLYRFDGVSAQMVDVPLADASTLEDIFAASSGDLWLGYGSGLTLMLPRGDFLHPRRIEGSIGIPTQFLQDSHGTMWVATHGGLYRNTSSGWRRQGADAGLQGERVYAARLDTEGTVWVLSEEGVFSLDAGQTRFRHRNDLGGWLNQIEPQLKIEKNAIVRNGLFYILDIVITSAGKRLSPSFSESRYAAITDANGGFWICNPTFGVIRTANPSREVLARFVQDLGLKRAPDPGAWSTLSTNSAMKVLEDRQHNVWVTTWTGLERFKPNLATTVPLPPGDLAYAMLPGDHGTIWFGNALSGPSSHWWHVDSVAVPTPGYELDTTATFRDIDGSVLLGTGEGFVQRFADGKFEAVDDLPTAAKKGDDIVAITRDSLGRLWLGIQAHAIYMLSHGQWITNGGFPQLPAKGILRAVTDAHGRLWLGYPHELFVIDGDHLTHYDSADGMTITNVRDILPDGIAIIGGDDGVAAFDGRRFHRISTLDPSVFTGINGIVRLKDGTVWLNGREGAVRISQEEFDHGFKDANYQVPLRVFGMADGMPGVAQPNRPLPSLIEGTDGRLWFANEEGIAWMDPAKIPQDHFEPSIVIRSVSAGDKTYQPDSIPSLAPGTRNVEIDYTVIGLSNPDKARFRYQLSGIDNEWQDVSGRRQAFYTNLVPGKYAFKVVATNEDGAWGKQPATVSFTIEPEFFQTKWFFALCVVVAMMLLWLTYLYRTRQLMQHLRQRLEERHAERDRIARELHDTYLQTVQALVIKVHAASHEMSEGTTKDKIVGALNLADDALAEGRNRIHALRAEASDASNLTAAFEAVARECGIDKPIAFTLTTTGTAKVIDPLVIDELYASGREAIINAFNHSCANAINVELSYSKEGIRLEITDDGKGIDPQVVRDGGIPGHWGLRGIRERMERVGGQCRLISDKQTGTTIILFVEASRAYRWGPHFH
jgi:signal transduction histidine kinase/ligand-binding sensor domain-containing protein